MTIQSSTSRISYNGDGVSTSFAIPWLFFNNGDIQAARIDSAGNIASMAINVDFTLSGAGVVSGGALTTTTVLPAGSRLSIWLDPPRTQLSDYVSNDTFPASTMETNLDREVQISQRLYDIAQHSIRAPDAEIDTWPAMPPATQRRGAALMFDASTGLPTLGTPAIQTLTAGLIGNLINPQTGAESSVSVVPFNTAYPPGDPYRYGVVGDGTTDDTAALQNWAKVPGYRRGRAITCKVSGTITFPPNSSVDFGGMQLDARAGGTFVNGQIVASAGTLTQIANLSVSPARSANSLTFAAAHGLAADDVIIIYNPTNSSWSPKQTYYREGEFAKVEFVSSSTGVKVWDALYSGYTAAAVNVYKLSRNEVEFRNLTVIAPDSGTISPIKVSLATKVRLVNCKGMGSDYTGINLDRCYDVDLTDCSVTVPVQVAASKYGVSIGNSHRVRIRGGEYRSFRHCFNIGGDDFAGAVPCRDIHISNLHAANDSAGSLAGALSSHANAQDIWFENIDVIGGGEFGGTDIHYINCRFHDFAYATGALIYGGTDWRGGVAEVRGCHIFGSLAYSQGLIRLSNDANTLIDSHLIVTDNTVEMTACDTYVRADLSSAATKINARIDGATFTAAPSLAQILRMVGTGAGGDADYISVTGVVNAPAGASLYTAVSGFGAAAKVSLMRQTGTVAIVSTAATTTNGAVTFRYSYGSKIPRVMCCSDTAYVGTHGVGVRAGSKAASGFTPQIFAADNTAFAAGTTVNVDWISELSET